MTFLRSLASLPVSKGTSLEKKWKEIFVRRKFNLSTKEEKGLNWWQRSHRIYIRLINLDGKSNKPTRNLSLKVHTRKFDYFLLIANKINRAWRTYSKKFHHLKLVFCGFAQFQQILIKREAEMLVCYFDAQCMTKIYSLLCSARWNVLPFVQYAAVSDSQFTKHENVSLCMKFTINM